MKTNIQNLRAAKIAVLIAASSIFSVPAFAATDAEPRYLSELDSCVSEITSKLDTTDVNRIRHVVTDYQRSSIGYALRFETSVFTADNETHYSVYCVADGDNKPVKFRYKEV